MGLRKFFRRATRKAENFAHRLTGKPNIGEDDSSRSQAAGQLMKRDVGIQRQAGSGQIKYTGQEEFES